MAGVVNLEQAFTPEENSRAEECAKKVQEVLDAHGCQLVAIPYLTKDGRTEAETHIVVKRVIQTARTVQKPVLVRP